MTLTTLLESTPTTFLNTDVSQAAHRRLLQVWWSQIKKCLHSDLLACDARVSLFVAAAQSYHYAALLRLLPGELQNIDIVLDAIVSLDRLERLSWHSFERSKRHVLLYLLHTVLVRHGECVALATLQRNDYGALYAHLKMPAPQQAPTQIFEVTSSLECPHTQAYVQLRERSPVRLGFYGARGWLDELYAMLTVGRLPHDKPIELLPTVDAVLQQCPHAASWGASRCGAMLRCVAAVEYVMPPEEEESALSPDQGKVIVRDANCMQISYLMFFGTSVEKYERMTLATTLSQTWSKFTEYWRRISGWFEENNHVLSMCVYAMCLCFTSATGGHVLHRVATKGLSAYKKGFLQI